MGHSIGLIRPVCGNAVALDETVMTFTLILVLLIAACLVHFLVTKPTVWLARRHGFLEAKWKRIVANVAIPALLFIVAGAAFEIRDDMRWASERQAYRERMAEQDAAVEKACGPEPEPKSGRWKEPDWAYLSCSAKIILAREAKKP